MACLTGFGEEFSVFHSRRHAATGAVKLSTPLIALFSLRAPAAMLPRLPKRGFYLFYPLHLLFFAWLSQA